jgi:hypothetical protein
MVEDFDDLVGVERAAPSEAAASVAPWSCSSLTGFPFTFDCFCFYKVNECNVERAKTNDATFELKTNLALGARQCNFVYRNAGRRPFRWELADGRSRAHNRG